MRYSVSQGGQRSRRQLAQVPGQPQVARLERYVAGDVGGPPGAEGGDQAGGFGVLLAAVQAALFV